MLILEEKLNVLRWTNVGELTADRMNGVIRYQSRGRSQPSVCNWNSSTIGSNLPLVVADYSDLQKLAEILFQRQNLAKPPFVGEGLPRGLGGAVDPLPATVDLPVRV